MPTPAGTTAYPAPLRWFIPAQDSRLAHLLPLARLPLSAGTVYALVISSSGGIGYVVVCANTSGGHSGGECGLSTDGGASWQALPAQTWP